MKHIRGSLKNEERKNERKINNLKMQHNKINGNFLNKLLDFGAKHTLYRIDGTWYHHLKKFPGILFDKETYSSSLQI